MARPTENDIMPFIDGIFFLWLRAPWNPAGFFYLSSEENGQQSIAHWSKRYATFELAEVDAKAEKKRAEERAKKK